MTVIICPACGTRYEIAAEIPPEGRRVRCSKCAHVWQAKAVVEAPRAAPGAPGAAPKPRAPAPRPAAPPRPAPAGPRPAAPPRPAPAAKAPPPRPGAAPPAQPAKPPPGGFFPKPANGAPPLGNRTPPPPKPNIPFGSDEDFQPDVPGNGGGATPISSWSSTEGSGADLGSYNAGALINPEAEAAANVSIAGEGKKRKLPPPVAIGWGALVLFLLIIAALVAMAPKTVVSMLPGANRLYAMLGSPVASNTFAIVDVRSSWTVAGGQQVLQVEGNVANLTGGEVTVPIVVITLQDEKGATLSEVGTKVPPLAAGAKGPFAVQIPTPPPAVRNVKVGFAKAE